jgi:hypothetical protein
MTDLHRKLLNLVYGYFRESGTWPMARWVEVEFVDDGDFESVADELGRDFIRHGSPAEPTSTCVLTIRGVAACNGSEDDVANYLRIIPRLSDAYKNGTSVKRVEIANAWSLSDLESKRLFELLHSNGTLTFGGSGSRDAWEEFGGSQAAFKLRNVTTLGQYLETLAQLYPGQQNQPALWDGESNPGEHVIPAGTNAVVPNVDTTLVADPELRTLITADLSELATCFAHGAWKSVGLLAGSVCEAMLIDLLLRHPAAIPAKHAAQWKSKLGLKDFAQFASDAGLISREGHILVQTMKKWRDLVHPWRATSSRSPSPAIARSMLTFLELLCADLETHRPASNPETNSQATSAHVAE